MTDDTLTGADLKAFHAHVLAGNTNRARWQLEDFLYFVDSKEHEIEGLRDLHGDDLAGLPDQARVVVHAELLDTGKLVRFRTDMTQWRLARQKDAFVFASPGCSKPRC